MNAVEAASTQDIVAGDDIQIEMFVNYVTVGGNTRRGQYFYSFDPDLVVVSQPQTRLVFNLHKEVPASFRIVDLVTSDAKYQLGNPKFAEGGRSVEVIDENTQRQLMYIVVLVKDTERNELVACDPQVVNSPEGTNQSLA